VQYQQKANVTFAVMSKSAREAILNAAIQFFHLTKYVDLWPRSGHKGGNGFRQAMSEEGAEQAIFLASYPGWS